MPKFGENSLMKRGELHPDLKILVDEAIKYFDFSIIEAYRGEAAQNEAFRTGHSTKKFPESKHNRLPSLAFDFKPYPNIDLSKERYCYYAGWFKALAMKLLEEGKMSNGLTWGDDWDDDTILNEHSLHDLGHIELDIPI